MKKVIILNGSPRANGNTKCAIKHLLAGIQRNKSLDIMEVNLTQIALKPCLACDVCKKNGGICVDSASATLMNSVLHADIIILATPVYWWGLSAQLKVAIDKFYSKSEIMGNMDKKIILVTVGAAPVDDPQYDLIQKQIEYICSHSNWKFISQVKASALKAGELAKQLDVLAEIEMQGEKLSDSL